MANEFIARKGIVVLANGLKVTGSSQFNANISASGNITASAFYGDGSNLTGVSATGLDIDLFGADLTGITVASTDKLPISDGGTEGRINVSQLSTPLAGTGLEANAGTIRIASTAAGNGLTGGAGSALSIDTSSAHFITGSISAVNLKGVISSSAQFTSLSAPFTGSFTGSFSGDGSGLTGIASTLAISGSTSGTDTVNLKTEGLTISGSNGITSTVTNNTITIGAPAGTVSSSAQVIASSVTGIGQYAQLTGSNNFTAVNTFSNTTNSTTFQDGAVVIVGGLGVGKDVNISGSLTVTGLLTAVSMSTQYVTASQYTIGTSRVIVNDDDLVRFAGLSVIDSGSTYGTGSLLWDSLNNRWLYQADDQAYSSAILIAGPKNTGNLGDEAGLVTGRIPVATGDDHIDNRFESSSIRVDFPSKLTSIEAGLYVTGSVSSSVGFWGDGSNLTGVVSTLAVTGSDGASTTTGNINLKTQAITYSAGEGVDISVSGQTVTIAGEDASSTNKGIAAFNSANFTVTSGQVTASAITFNGTALNLGSSYAFGLQNITPSGASTTDQLNLQGGAIIRGVLFSSASATSIAGPVTNQVIATVATSSYDSAMFDYIVKDGTNYRAGTVMAVWNNSGSVEFTDTSTNDIGDTLDESFVVDVSGANARLKFTSGTGTWTVKTAIRAL
jgi:hypothetical protein